MGRSILAVVVGFLVIGALAAGVAGPLVAWLMPHAFDPVTGGSRDVAALLVVQAGVALCATFGCWLTARLAPARPMFHALVLGGLGFAFKAVGAAMQWDNFPVWHWVLSLALTMPYAYAGGWIRERQLEAAPGTPAMA
jgi:hypothetical protein